MKTFHFIFLALFSIAAFAEVEIELATGSKFKGNVKELTRQFVIVDTKIGELKLTRSMLSPACRRSLRSQPPTEESKEVPKEKPKVNVKVSYREKMLDREKDVGRHGRKHELKRKAGVITVFLNDLPRGKSFSGYVEYSFRAEATARRRGEKIDFDKGVKRFEIEPNQAEPKIEIESKAITHFSAKHTGDRIGERGMKLKGYSVKVYLDGFLVCEQEK